MAQLKCRNCGVQNNVARTTCYSCGSVLPGRGIASKLLYASVGLMTVCHGLEAIFLHRAYTRDGLVQLSPTAGIAYGSLLIFIVLLLAVIFHIAERQGRMNESKEDPSHRQ